MAIPKIIEKIRRSVQDTGDEMSGTYNLNDATLNFENKTIIDENKTKINGQFEQGFNTQAIGNYSHAEGNETKASGNDSHAEGAGTEASGRHSHAEGADTIAAGSNSHAEGSCTEASGDNTHAEGRYSIAVGANAHAEGGYTEASGRNSHAEGADTIAVGKNSHAEGGSYFLYSTNDFITGTGSTFTLTKSYDLDTSPLFAFLNYDNNFYMINEYNSTNNQIELYETIDEELNNEPVKLYYGGENGNHVINMAFGHGSHTEGADTFAYNDYSHAEGDMTIASGYASHAEGIEAVASGDASHASGIRAVANYECQTAIGKYNKNYSNVETLFVVGNGTNEAKNNAFRVDNDGTVYAHNRYKSAGADYAEYFEWKDSNPNNEDRRGYFVTLDEDQIKIAKTNDYILGVVSALPAIIGNADNDWSNKYLKDEFGSFIYEEKIFIKKIKERVYDKETEDFILQEKQIEKTEVVNKINPDYDPNQEYIFRENRPEWDAIGMMGVLVVRDDGTCQVNGYCSVTDEGIATASEIGYRVIKRINDNIIKIVFR